MQSDQLELELLKHELAMTVEQKKWEFKKEELQYLEAGQHLRSLNQLLWQIPSMVIAVTGGIWYGATTVSAVAPKIVALSFAAIVNFLTMIIIWRLRSIIERHIHLQAAFSQTTSHTNEWWKRVVVLCWSFILICAAAASVVGAVYADLLDKKNTESQPLSSCSSITVIEEAPINMNPISNEPKILQKKKPLRCPSAVEK